MSATTTQFEDKTLTCRDCGKDFVWTADEQAFYESKGFKNAPVRCPECRQLKRDKFKRDRVLTTITCAECGKQDTVPFKPKGDRPVLCADCFKKHKEQGGEEARQPVQASEQPTEEAVQPEEVAPAVAEEPKTEEVVTPEANAAESTEEASRRR